MELVDTHAHPHFDKFSDPGQLLADAATVGVKRVIAVGTTLDDSKRAIDFARTHDNVWATAGVHPHDAMTFLKSLQGQSLQQGLSLQELLALPKVVAVGEIGLDYFKNYTPKEPQIKAFREQLEIGLGMDLPFVFHVREAFEDFIKIFDEYQSEGSPIRGVVHSFSAHKKELDQVISRGLYVGLNGIMTFTKDHGQLEAAKQVPLSSLLVETDAPFLAPKSRRGDICEPKDVLEIAEFLSELRSESLEYLAEITTKNAEELFGIA